MAIFTSKTPTVEAWQWADFGDRAAAARWIVRVVEAEGGEARYEPQQETRAPA